MTHTEINGTDTPKPGTRRGSRAVAVALSASALVCGAAAGADDIWETHVHTNADGKKLPYRLMKPAEVKAGAKYPLVIFLHGAGERGDDNKAQLKWGMGDFAKDGARKENPCFVFAPQCPRNGWWSGGRGAQSDKPSEAGGNVLEVIEKLRKDLPVDEKRIYLTGLSMGGFGTWDLAIRKPELFAAIAPICGGGDPSKAAALAKVPCWCFHGGADPTVKPELSRAMIEAIKKAGGTPKYTEYPGVGHNSWSQTYSDPEFHKWLFAQKKE